NPISLKENVPERVGRYVLSDGNRKQSSLFDGELIKIGKINQAQNISVHHNERFGQLLPQQGQRPNCPEWLGFPAEHQPHAILRAVADEALQVIRHMIGGQEYLVKSVLLEAVDLDLQHRLLANRQ